MGTVGNIHNVKCDDKAIRLYIDTRAMERFDDVRHFPIPTAQQLRYKFLESDRYSTLDMNHAFHQLELRDSSKDLFKFTTLVMGAHGASAECHAKLSKILEGLE